MTIRKIQTGDAAILRQKSQSVEQVDAHLLQLIDDMFETMKSADGIGLAAPQIAVGQRVIVVDIESYCPECPPIALINPVITKSRGEELDEEGCLSLPGVRGSVRRASCVTIEAILTSEKRVTLSAKDLMARVLQHEIDHLDGILFTDRLKPEDQELLVETPAREAD